MGQLIPFDEGITTVVGRTRSGKTYGTKQSLAKQSRGVLFFNTQLEDMPRGFVKANGCNTVSQIRDSLRDGKKINFLPSTVDAERKAQLTFIINEFFDGGMDDFYFVVDEVHLYTDDKDARAALVRLATTGLRFGKRAVWISQRGAKIDNTLMTQSTLFVFYETNMEGQYYKQYGIPHDQIAERIAAAGEYAYCTFDGKEVKGAFKV
jgi:hypothetical protein